MKKVRESNIELLRIFAMLLIISFHYVYKSGYIFSFDILTTKDYLLKMFYFFGELGVNLFVLIMGYFQVKGKFSFKRLIKIILEVNFYYFLGIYISYRFNIYIEPTLTNFKDYFLAFFPAILNRTWFITAYLLVYCLSPFLNTIITKMKKVEYKHLLLAFILIWSIIPTFFGIFYNTTETLLYYNRFIWFIIIYFIGAYIQLYGLKIFKNKNNCWYVALVTFIFMIVSMIFIHKYNYGFLSLGLTEVAYFWPPNTFPMLILSVAIFYIFLNLKIKRNKIINTIASTTLGIYLIHDGLLVYYIWGGIFKSKEYLMGPHPFLAIIISTLIIFVVGALIDLLRQLLEKITVDKILNSKWSQKVENFLKTIINKIENFI